MTEAEAKVLGEKLAELFNLKIDKATGYYKTSFGGKTAVGLARCVERLQEDVLKERLT